MLLEYETNFQECSTDEQIETLNSINKRLYYKAVKDANDRISIVQDV